MKHKDYKEKYAGINMERKGQATIFVIIAILIVAAIAIIYFYFPNVAQIVTGGEFTPNSYLKSCVQPTIDESVEVLSKQGGYSDPEGFVLYEGEKVKYLCYSSEYYQTCAIQQPMIKKHFEEEIEARVLDKADSCVRDLKTEYEKQGYSVKVGTVSNDVQIVPGAIKVIFNTDMTVSKDTTRNFDKFEVDIQSEMYDLLLTAQSVVDFEATYGDIEIKDYLSLNPNTKIDKIKLSEGTTVYRLNSAISDERFTFASRSLAWPPGYGLE